MINYLKNLNRNQEFLIVFTLAFGLFIFFSTRFSILSFQLEHHGSVTTSATNKSYYFTLTYELLAISFLWYFLKLRNWKIDDFNILLSLKLIGVGILLYLINNVMLYLISQIPLNFSSSNSPALYQLDFKTTAKFSIIVLSSVVIHPFYEEIFLIGYLGKWFKDQNPSKFIFTSLIIRISFHTYQGVYGVIGVTVLGLIFSIYYLKYKNLTPVIFAHALYNLSFYLHLEEN